MWHDWHDRKSGWKRFSHHNLYIHEWNRFKQGLEIADIYVCGWFKVIRLALTLLSQSVRVSVRPGEEIKQSHRPTFIHRTFIALFIFLLPESPRWWGRLSASSYSLALKIDTRSGYTPMDITIEHEKFLSNIMATEISLPSWQELEQIAESLKIATNKTWNFSSMMNTRGKRYRLMLTLLMGVFSTVRWATTKSVDKVANNG